MSLFRMVIYQTTFSKHSTVMGIKTSPRKKAEGERHKAMQPRYGWSKGGGDIFPPSLVQSNHLSTPVSPMKEGGEKAMLTHMQRKCMKNMAQPAILAKRQDAKCTMLVIHGSIQR